jgi:predicted RecA/RadA family phage recombinase
MANNFTQEGKRITFTAVAALLSGALVLLEDLAVVALGDVALGEAGVGAVDGVWELGGKAQETIAQGAKLYWNPAGDPYDGTPGSGCITTVAAGGKYIGIAWAGAAETATTVQVKLNA